MKVHTLWIPFWRGRDQSLSVGETKEVTFFKAPPTALGAVADLIFAPTDGTPDELVTARATVERITHDTLGEVASIAAHGARYAITMADGSRVEVASDEASARAHASPAARDWRMVVLLTDVTFIDRRD